MKVDPSMVNHQTSALQPGGANTSIAGAAAYGGAPSVANRDAVPSPAGNDAIGSVGAASRTTGSHRLHLSPAASRMMASANDPSNDIDTAKVDAIRASLANGTYRISSSNIADGMLQGSREMLSRPA